MIRSLLCEVAEHLIRRGSWCKGRYFTDCEGVCVVREESEIWLWNVKHEHLPDCGLFLFQTIYTPLLTTDLKLSVLAEMRGWDYVMKYAWHCLGYCIGVGSSSNSSGSISLPAAAMNANVDADYFMPTSFHSSPYPLDFLLDFLQLTYSTTHTGHEASGQVKN